MQDILNITGTFDAAKFNRIFDEDTIKLTKLNLEKQELSEDEFENEDSIVDSNEFENLPPKPVDRNSFEEELKKRTMTFKPISKWFLIQLVNSSTGRN